MKNIGNTVAIIQQDTYIFTALLRDNQLDNLMVDIKNTSPRVGDIYLCRVSHIVQNINAAFVEIQKNVMCYMPLNEINTRDGKVVQGQVFPVQIIKAAVKTKQAVVSKKLELTGRYSVITSLNTQKAVSAKIPAGENRIRLNDILASYEEENVGMILRTNCLNARDDVIKAECQRLLVQMHEILEKGQTRTAFTKLHSADMEYIRFLRNRNTDSIARVVTDIPEIYKTIKNSMEGEFPLQFYEDENYPLDKMLGITSKIQKALAKHVWLKSGGSLVIEPTEALTVIDVNTEKAISGKRSCETTFFRINCEAAVEAARQLRIRNISGIILIDFIDMKDKNHISELLNILKTEVERDDVPTTVVDITKLGLVEITRMKVRKPLWESLSLKKDL